jgi:Papain-like cysteine protease AvrRpt2
MSVLREHRIPLALETPPSAGLEAGAPPAAALPGWRRLSFTMQRQQQTQWCWAATSVSIARFYDGRTGWTQCGMVDAELGQHGCCRDGGSARCNQPNVLNAPLARADVLARMQGAAVGYSAIRAEIDAGRPLAWRIGWSGGGGHFAVIEGYQRRGAQWVAIDDPWYGQSDVAVSTLRRGRYQQTGTWTHTYFTRPSP